mmetsp:Transcript_13134/g.30511  ORF Transcript_13134/g.30511 Transcript_13134/m.30511 type:complete len:242 (-) Transcript_13134:603-1328(-)
MDLVERLVQRVVEHDLCAVRILKLFGLPFLLKVPIGHQGRFDPPLLMGFIRDALIRVREKELHAKLVTVKWEAEEVGPRDVELDHLVEPLRHPTRLQVFEVAVAFQVQALAHNLARPDHPRVAFAGVCSLLVHGRLFLPLLTNGIQDAGSLLSQQVLTLRLVHLLGQHLQRGLPCAVDVCDHGVVQPRVRPVELGVHVDCEVPFLRIVTQALDRKGVHRHPQGPSALIAHCTLIAATPREL